MLWLLYQVALSLLLLLAAPFLLLRRGRHTLQTIPARLGRRSHDHASPVEWRLWLHAVSVGEVGVAATFLRSVSERIPWVVSTITPTGQQEARRLLAERALIAYFPFDLDFSIRRFFEVFRPRALVLVEGELWPLVLRRARLRKMPIVVINGRVSDRNFRRLRRLRPFLSPLLSPVSCFAVQSSQDRDRLLELGVADSRIEVTGNLKFDSPPPTRNFELEASLRKLAAGRWLMIAGSTMEAEESILLDALSRLGGGDRILLLLAPRHPQRCTEVAGLLDARGLAFCRRSELLPGRTENAAPMPSAPLPSILLLDSLGELAGLYAIADAAFVGGTLVDTGGHNPLEAARFGTPVVVGPSMYNFPSISRLFDSAQAWHRVGDAGALAKCWQLWLDRPEVARAQGRRGAQLVEENRGAVGRTLAIVERYVPELRS